MAKIGGRKILKNTGFTECLRKNGCFREESLNVLRGRNVVLFPDLGAADNWAAKIPAMERMKIKVKLFDYMEQNATEKQRAEGFDIADFLLEMKQPQAILQAMITKNPTLNLLIKELDLVLIEERAKPIQTIKKRGFKL